MIDFFPDHPIYDSPTFLLVIYSMIWAFVLSSMIAITHRITFTGPHYPNKLFQALALSSIVSTMVMLAIGDSLARGLGAFGALAIIRFRTRIQDPRNILFIFASLSIGLAIGVFGFSIAFAGTLIFCSMALFLHFTPLSTKKGVNGRLTFRLNDANDLQNTLNTLKKYCSTYSDVQVTARNSGNFDYEYLIEMKSSVDTTFMLQDLQNIESIRRVQISFKNINEDN